MYGGQAPQGAMLSIYLMNMVTSFPGDRFKTFVFWAPPVLLSRVLSNMFAQNLDLLCPTSCWHLLALLNRGDEVKGRYPFAYEDRISEARSLKFYSFFGFVQQQVDRFTCFTWHLNVVKLLWVVLQANLQNSVLLGLRSDIRLVASRKGIGVQVNKLGPQSLVFIFLFGLYWICMLADYTLIL